MTKAASNNEESPRYAQPAARTSILIVDDEPGLRVILQDYLQLEGYEVQTAIDGEDAIEKLQQRSFDLILTDLDMPKMDGLALVNRMNELKKQEDRPMPLVIFMTGYGTVETAVDAMKSGAWDFLLKPFKIDQLAAVIARAKSHLQLQQASISLPSAQAIHDSALNLNIPTKDANEYLRTASAGFVDAVGADQAITWRNTLATGTSVWYLLDCQHNNKRAPVIPNNMVPNTLFNDNNRITLAQMLRGGEPIVLSPNELASIGFIPNDSIDYVGQQIHAMLIPLTDREGRYGVTMLLSRQKPYNEGQRRAVQILSLHAASVITSHFLLESFEATVEATIKSLVNALEAKDTYTKGHSYRVSEWATLLARQLELPQSDVRNIRTGALLHDIGKIGMDLETINKREKLTDEEYEVIKMHPELGAKILDPVRFLRPMVPMVLHHHERFDGRGYPFGIKGNEIPLGARIIAVADAWEVMITDRAYRPARSVEEAQTELSRNAGSQFDSEIVEAMMEIVGEYSSYDDVIVRGGRANDHDYLLVVEKYDIDVTGIGGETLF